MWHVPIEVASGQQAGLDLLCVVAGRTMCGFNLTMIDIVGHVRLLSDDPLIFRVQCNAADV